MNTLNRHEPLYLKHRPNALNKLVGQAAVSQTLKNALEHDRISHAYLFTGPRGTGKTSTARILARSLNCELGPTATPCQTCTTCREIAQGISPAVFEIDAASNNSVDDARVLIERAPLVAVGGRFKLYIIDECHMLTKEAFNALLKTIEEPPPSVVFILATTEEHKVPPTIISRCQRLMFRLVSQSDLVSHLSNIAQVEGIQIEESAIELIARRSNGGLRDALGLLDQASLLASNEKPVAVKDLLTLLGSVHEDILLEISHAVEQRNGQKVISLTNTLLAEGKEPAVLCSELARHFLNLAKASYLKTDQSLAPDMVQSLVLGSAEYIQGLFEQSSLFERSELAQIVESLDKLESTCRRSSQPTMHLEIGLLSICHRHDMVLVKELGQRVSLLEDALSKYGEVGTRVIPVSHPIETTPKPITPPSIATSNQSQNSNNNPVSKEPTSTQPDISISQISPPAPQAPSPPKLETDPSQTSKQTSSTNVPFEELNAFWERLLEGVKHIPTLSILSTQAFLISANAHEVVLGVQTEALRKVLENKLSHITPVAEQILDNTVRVRVKVITNTDTPKESLVTTASSKPYKTISNPEAMTVKNQLPPEMQISLSDTVNTTHLAEKTEKSTAVKEAYRLFEGPGSRRITPN